MTYASILTKPSYYALVITGLIILFVLIIFLRNFSQFKNQTNEKGILTLSLIGILIGIHGLLHLGLETVYNFNPMEILLR
jgi:hypothetical protein